jgi:hypothetical protein
MCSIGLVLAGLGAGLLAQGADRRSPAQKADPFVGTWILNLSKSTFQNMLAPKSQTRTFDYERDGLILNTTHTVNPDGTTAFAYYMFSLDGKEGHEELSRRSMSPSADHVQTFLSGKKVNDRAIEVTFTRNGKWFVSHSWSVSEDGKTLTAKRKSTNAQGQPTYSEYVYDKQ